MYFNEFHHGVGIAAFRREGNPVQGFELVFGHEESVQERVSERPFVVGVARVCGGFAPFHGFCEVALDEFPLAVDVAQVRHRRLFVLRGGFFEPLHGLCRVGGKAVRALCVERAERELRGGVARHRLCGYCAAVRGVRLSALRPDLSEALRGCRARQSRRREGCQKFFHRFLKIILDWNTAKVFPDSADFIATSQSAVFSSEYEIDASATTVSFAGQGER